MRPFLNPEDQVAELEQDLGFILVVLIVLFFYRRDWVAATEYWKQQNVITTRLVEQSVKAQVELAAVIRENTTVTHGLKRIVEDFPSQCPHTSCPLRDVDATEYLRRSTRP